MIKPALLTLTAITFALQALTEPANSQISEFKITASDASTSSFFGKSVAIFGDYAVVGAYIDDEQGTFAGKAYIFKRSDTSWTEEVILLPAEVTNGDEFGISVAIYGDYAIVGARWDDDNGDNSGSAYIFKRSGTTWTQEVKLLASDGVAGDLFGHSVSIFGDYIVVGANGDDDNGDASGSAYVFKRNDTTWTEEAKLLASDGLIFDDFGYSVSLYGDYAIVGAKGHDELGNGSGSAYMFMRSGTTWTEQVELLASDGTLFDYFGYSVSLSSDHALIGAEGESDNGSGAGAVYLYNLTDSTLTGEVKLLASDGAAGDGFGSSVSISGDYILVGAWEDDDSANASGSAYLFNLSGTGWIEVDKFIAFDGAATNWFGESVSISGDYAIVGANGHSDNGGSSGAAYLYTGFITDGPPFVANPLMDIEVNEDFGSIIVALLDTVFDDPDLPNDNLSYFASVSSEIINSGVSEDTLRIFSVPDLNGMVKVVVTAVDDSSLTASDSFWVTVLPVEDDPTEFTLVFPLGDTLNTLLPVFTWNAALDADSADAIEYRLMISELESMESPVYTEITLDTSHTVSIPLTDDIKYYWTVSAKDTIVGQKLDYTTQVEPIFTNNCTSRGCHVPGNTGGGLNLEVGTSFGEITGSNTTANAPLVIPNDPDISPLIWKLEGVDNNGNNVFGSRMPFGGPFLSQSTVDIIRLWISEGANETVDDSSGQFSYSDTSSFLLDRQESPLAFSLISPEDESSIDSLRPLFSWDQSIDPDPRD